MTAVRARLDRDLDLSSQRTTPRRKLHLEAFGSAESANDVLILDISTTGLLIKTTDDLRVGETIELDLPNAPGLRAIVKWSSGQHFGCQFKAPVSVATVSAALLRAPSGPLVSEISGSANTATIADDGHDDDEDKLPLTVRLRGIAGLVLLSWAAVAAPIMLAWPYIR